MTNPFTLSPGHLTMADIVTLSHNPHRLCLKQTDIQRIEKSCSVLKKLIEKDQKIYGVNTGFGKLASERIEPDALGDLQARLIYSHAAGVGEPFSERIVGLTLLLKINSLAQGYSAIRHSVIEALMTLYNEKMLPCVPSQGSVGASGDLAPLAHCAGVLLGLGEVTHEGACIPAQEALNQLKIDVLPLHRKEGLALLNGTQVSTALALEGFFNTVNLFETALVAGAMSVDAIQGSTQPFDARVNQVRRLDSQIQVAKILRTLLEGSEINRAHAKCDKLQDPYSFRCQPQVMGAVLSQIRYAQSILEGEMNAVTDNPLVFAEDEVVLSGGNFHAQPVGFACDALAHAIAEIGALSERRLVIMVDANLSGLPAFLIQDSGLNSGFMIAQVTAAALVSENKHLAHSVSTDSLPTSANQEDHVSMATYAARRLQSMCDNLGSILAIELMMAAQGLDFHAPKQTSSRLTRIHQKVRERVPFLKKDDYMAPHIENIKQEVMSAKYSFAGLDIKGIMA